jgi:hypothetical protein
MYINPPFLPKISLEKGIVLMVGVVVTGLADVEAALIELRELEWRFGVKDYRLGFSATATDIPAHLMQPEVGDIAGDYSETLLTNASGKELLVRKLDSRRPRTPLGVGEVTRRAVLMTWLDTLLVRDAVTGEVVDAMDKRIVWEASTCLWRGEPFNWKRIKAALSYPRSTSRLSQRYQEALARLLCRAAGVSERNAKGYLSRESGYFGSAARRESLGFGAVKW